MACRISSPLAWVTLTDPPSPSPPVTVWVEGRGWDLPGAGSLAFKLVATSAPFEKGTVAPTSALMMSGGAVPVEPTGSSRRITSATGNHWFFSGHHSHLPSGERIR